jgi:hypothetical protein
MYPNYAPKSVSQCAVQLFRFVCEIDMADLVVCPSDADGEFHIGRVTDRYSHDLRFGAYPNLRPVKWLNSISNLKLAISTVSEFTSEERVFQIRRGAQEFLTLQTVNEGSPPSRQLSQSSRHEEKILPPKTNRAALAIGRMALETRQYKDLVHRVLCRDKWKCRVSECGRRSNLQAHHLTFRSEGGNDSEKNLLTICPTCHEALHSGLLLILPTVEGTALNANAELRFSFAMGWMPRK